MLTMYIQMLPVLQAREALQEATVIAMGTGALRKSDAEQTRREWLKLAELVEPLDLGKADPGMARARLEAMGFRVSE